MPISAFELFRIGIGPSSSHTVGPMRAVRRFLDEAVSADALEQIARIHVELHGSLALTGKGHGTDRAVLLGLLGDRPESIDVDSIEMRLRAVANTKQIALLGKRHIPFDPRGRCFVSQGSHPFAAPERDVLPSVCPKRNTAHGVGIFFDWRRFCSCG